MDSHQTPQTPQTPSDSDGSLVESYRTRGHRGKVLTPLTIKLDELAAALNLIPKTKKATKNKITANTTQKEIKPVLVICPKSVVL